ncbi:hypothetical protein [Actinopolymorpha pittospori]
MSVSLVPVPAPVSVGAGVEIDGSAADVEVRPHTHSFTSGWGQEFGPVTAPLWTPSLASLAGRSSAKTHPWCAVREQGGGGRS